MDRLSGLVCGIAVCIGQMWWRNNRLSPGSVRPDGPTLAEPRMRVAALGAEAAFLEAVRGHIAAGKVQQ